MDNCELIDDWHFCQFLKLIYTALLHFTDCFNHNISCFSSIYMLTYEYLKYYTNVIKIAHKTLEFCTMFFVCSISTVNMFDNILVLVWYFCLIFVQWCAANFHKVCCHFSGSLNSICYISQRNLIISWLLIFKKYIILLVELRK